MKMSGQPLRASLCLLGVLLAGPALAEDLPSARSEARRVARVVRTPGKEETKAGIATRSFLALGNNIQGLEILSGPAGVKRAVEKLNRQLILRYFECMDSGAESDAKADFSGGVALVAATRHFMLLRQSATYWCGGAHPDHDREFLILDRRGGEPIDIAAWLKVPPASLGRAYWKNGADGCADALSDGTEFLLWPTPEGLAMEPILPHAIDACADQVTVPYARLAKKLSPAGRRAIAEFAGAAK